jgi:hypothetical protein
MNDAKIEKMFNYPDMFGPDEFKQGFEYLYNELRNARLHEQDTEDYIKFLEHAMDADHAT